MQSRFIWTSETLIKEGNILPDINYINLTNSLAILQVLGLTDKEDEYYNKGIELAISDNSSLAFNMITAMQLLWKLSKIQKGDYFFPGWLNVPQMYMEMTHGLYWSAQKLRWILRKIKRISGTQLYYTRRYASIIWTAQADES